MTNNETITKTASTCEIIDNITMYGTGAIGMGIDEDDDRPIPDQFTIECAIGDMLDILEGLAEDTKLADHLAEIAASFTTSVHYQLKKIETRFDNKRAELAALNEEADGSEINDTETNRQMNASRDLGQRLEMLETLRDVLAANIDGRYRMNWQPPRGSYYSRNRSLTATKIMARDYIKSTNEQACAAKMPTGTKIGFSGGNDYQDVKSVWDYLDRVKQRVPDMVLVHGGSSRGAELIASKWASTRGVAQIACPPDWKTHQQAAPFRRNDAMLKLGLAGMIVTPGTGIQENIAEKAAAQKIKVVRIGIAPRHEARAELQQQTKSSGQ